MGGGGRVGEEACIVQSLLDRRRSVYCSPLLLSDQL